MLSLSLAGMLLLLGVVLYGPCTIKPSLLSVSVGKYTDIYGSLGETHSYCPSSETLTGNAISTVRGESSILRENFR